MAQMGEIKLVLFDVDGVLLDSLVPHLRICQDKSREYQLNLRIPNPSEFRTMVRAGVKISPMKFMFMAVGFPEALAQKADDQYKRVFSRDYVPTVFPGVYETLRSLHHAGRQLGIVTANVKANVTESLDSVTSSSAQIVFIQRATWKTSPRLRQSRQQWPELV